MSHKIFKHPIAKQIFYLLKKDSEIMIPFENSKILLKADDTQEQLLDWFKKNYKNEKLIKITF